MPALTRQQAYHAVLIVKFEQVAQHRRAGFAAKHHADGVHAQQHVDQLEVKPGRLYAEREIRTNLCFAVKPTVGAAHARDHHRRRQRDIVCVARHDRFKVASVPGIALCGGPVPSVLPSLHRPLRIPAMAPRPPAHAGHWSAARLIVSDP